MRWLALCALVACQGARSAERQEEFAQALETRRDEGPVRVTETVEEYDGRELGISDDGGSGAVTGMRGGSLPQQRLVRRAVTVTERAPVVTTSASATNASTEAESHSSYRFGFSPWQLAIGAAVLAALAYAAFRLKAKFGL